VGVGRGSYCRNLASTNNRVFFGIDNGRVYRVDNAQNGTSSTVTNISGSGLPNGYISSVAVGANDNELLITYTNYGVNSVWYTSNGGSSWTSKEGNLPDMPIRWALFNPSNTNEVLLATEQGVWSTDNLSATNVDWGVTNTGLANTRTDMLQYRSSDGQVTVATHGRGAFTGFPFNGTPPPSCDVPTGLAASSVTQTSFTASWNAVSGATSYDLDVNGTVFNTTSTSYNVTGLSASTAYPISVRANCSGGSSAYSATVNVTTQSGGSSGPSCSTTISSFPYNEGFESGTGAFSQASGDDLDWSRDSGGTPSSGTGPSSGNGGSSWYMYVEASGNNTGYPNKVAIFESPCFDLSAQSTASLNFAYHSFGTATTVNLTVEATTDGSTWSSIFSVTGNQGNQWNDASVDLSAYLGSTVKFRFVGTTGTTWQGDVAIDDIQVSNSAAPVTLYSQGWESGGMGDWTNNGGDDFNWTARSGGTPSNNTGPSGAVEGSYYNYTEASGSNYPSKVAIMTSPAISLSGQSDASVTFSYHMFGASNMGGLVLEASSNGSSWSNVWSRSGNQGNQWSTSSVDLGAYAGGTLYLRFVGTTGSTWQGDMCVDALSVNNQPAPLAAETYFGGATTAENFAPEFDLAIYPNPTQDIVTITAKGMEDAFYSVTTLQGQVIARGSMQEDTQVNLSNWSAGMYLLTIRKGEQQIIRQIVKE
ncbi:MAG: T9SS type A sorting domain-containing protein, partial [Bacteroidota bacterium]